METTAGNSFSQQCSSCDEASARCWCLDCNEALCDVCVSAHRRVTVTRSHRILNQPPAGGVSTPPTKFCRLHPSEPLKLFCFTCSQLTCRDCQLMAHMNHRYQFVSEALAGLKKELEVWVQPIRAHRDKVRQSLLDMETRLQDIVQSEAQLKVELQQSFSVLFQHLQKRMVDILKQSKTVCESECDKIQRRMRKLKQLQQQQQSLTEAAEEAQRTSELSALLGHRAQIESHLKDLVDQDLSPPRTMSQLMVVCARNSLETILNFGKLEVSWIPFSVSQTSNQNTDTPAAAASSPLTLSCGLQTRNTCDTDSPVPAVPANCPSTSSKSSSNQMSVSQSNAPMTTGIVVPFTQTVKHASCSTVKKLSHLGTNPAQVLLLKTPVQPVSTSVNLQPVSFRFPLSAGLSQSCKVLKLVQPSEALNKPPAVLENQPATIMLSHRQLVYQLSCMPQFPMMLSQTESSILSTQNHPELQTNLSSRQMLPVAASSSKSTPPSSTCPSSSCRPLQQTGTTNQNGPGGSLNCPSTSQNLSNQFCPIPLSSALTASYSSSTTPSTSTCSATTCRLLPHTENSSDAASTAPDNHLNTSRKTSSNQLCLSPLSSSSSFSSSSVTPPPTTCPLPSCRTLPQTENTCETVSPVPANFPSTSSKSSSNQMSVSQSNTPVTTSAAVPVTQTVKHASCSTSPRTLLHAKDKGCSAVTSPECLNSDISPRLSSLKLQPQSPVVKAVADSACDCSVQQITARRQETAENEPTSTVSEETEPAGKPSEPEVPEKATEEPSSAIGHPDCSLSQWQPRVSLFRLPVPLPRPGCPLPGFSVVPGAAGDKIYLKEMSEDTESHVDDIVDDVTEPLSSPESPVTLQIVTCSACGSTFASIICSACGRGYHRACHVPPVGPDMWSDWLCALCQDLSDPSDPYSCDRPQRAQRAGLSVQDQRRCESLLLYLMVEGCSRLSEFASARSHLKSMSERLIGRSPSYETAADFLSDTWSLFKDASQDDDVLNKLQESFQSRLMETFRAELHPSVLLPPSSRNTNRGKVTSEEQEVMMSEEQEVITSKSKVLELRKRLRDFLLGAPGSKRTKTDKTPPPSESHVQG